MNNRSDSNDNDEVFINICPIKYHAKKQQGNQSPRPHENAVLTPISEVLRGWRITRALRRIENYHPWSVDSSMRFNRLGYPWKLRSNLFRKGDKCEGLSVKEISGPRAGQQSSRGQELWCGHQTWESCPFKVEMSAEEAIFCETEWSRWVERAQQTILRSNNWPPWTLFFRSIIILIHYPYIYIKHWINWFSATTTTWKSPLASHI